jgi:hypothetical protein
MFKCYMTNNRAEGLEAGLLLADIVLTSNEIMRISERKKVCSPKDIRTAVETLSQKLGNYLVLASKEGVHMPDDVLPLTRGVPFGAIDRAIRAYVNAIDSLNLGPDPNFRGYQVPVYPSSQEIM